MSLDFSAKEVSAFRSSVAACGTTGGEGRQFDQGQSPSGESSTQLPSVPRLVVCRSVLYSTLTCLIVCPPMQKLLARAVICRITTKQLFGSVHGDICLGVVHTKAPTQ